MTNESDPTASVSLLFQKMRETADSEDEAIERSYQYLAGTDLLRRVTLHKYQCQKDACQIATVFRVDGDVLCAVRDYKFSPGLNQQTSVEAARRKNTLDGNRWWPGHVYNVSRLDSPYDIEGNRSRILMACRHFHGMIRTADILATVEGVTPGHYGKTRL